jgi:VIT1/CCC1 family predicted Fe2+/Mn2+ transporter
VAHDSRTLAQFRHAADGKSRWTSGRGRAAVFGASDGLVSNLALVAGVAGATTVRTDVLVGGMAGLVAGAISMAAGEYVSMKANAELLANELDVERSEIEADPTGELLELASIYEQRGLDRDSAMSVAAQLMSEPEVALQAHARDELGIDPEELGSPVGAASASFLAFAVGATVPLLPWFFIGGSAAVVASLVLGAIAAIVLGGVVGRLAGRSVARSAARQLAIVGIAFAVTNVVGRLVGAAVL